MAEIQDGNWDEDFNEEKREKPTNSSSNSNYTKTEYLKMDVPGDYRFRLVGTYVRFYRHFKPYKATVQEAEKGIDPAWQAGWYPQERFAINVIDRADGKLKVMEKPFAVFKHFNNYRKTLKKDPTKNEGPDWQVTVAIPKKDGKPNKIKTEYTVMYLEPTPFTEKEKEMLCEGTIDAKTGKFTPKKDPTTDKPISKLWPLKKIYKSTSAEAMKKMWDELPADKKTPPKREPKEGSKPSSPAPADTGAEPIEESMSNAPADNGSDMFDKASDNKVAETDSTSMF